MTLFLFFFSATAPTEIYTLSLHDALPIYEVAERIGVATNNVAEYRAVLRGVERARALGAGEVELDRKSTRLNSSHQIISYAVFCLKKKKKTIGQKNRWNKLDTIVACYHER